MSFGIGSEAFVDFIWKAIRCSRACGAITTVILGGKVLGVNIPVIEDSNIMACKDNICEFPIARPSLGNVPIWWSIDSTPRLDKLVSVREKVISCIPVVVLLGRTAGEIGRSGILESMAREFYEQGQTRALEDDSLTQCHRRTVYWLHHGNALEGMSAQY